MRNNDCLDIGTGYPRIFNSEMDPREDISVSTFLWVYGPALQAVTEYKKALEKYPSPPVGNMTRF